MKRIRFEKLQGVYYREDPTRKHNGKPDRCFDIAYRTAGGRQGKVIWEKVGWASQGYTAQMASKVRGDRIRAIHHGEELPQEKRREAALTFGTLWDEYAEWAKVNRKSFKAETNRYEKHIKPAIGKMPVTEITAPTLEDIKSTLHKKNLSPQTIKHVLVLIRQVLNKGLEWERWHGDNPIKKVEIPRPNNKRMRFLSYGEADKVLNALATISPQWRDITLLSLHTGMRAGEIFDLKWSHIDLENGIIYIGDPKPGEAQRAYMTPTIKGMLSSNMGEATPNEWVFKAKDGGQIKEVSDTFERTIRRLGFNDGIEDRRQKVCFHTCRHTFASWLALAGEPILTIKELMRHSSLAMTERYAHLIPDHKRQAMNVIEERMNRWSEPGKTASTAQPHQVHTG